MFDIFLDLEKRGILKDKTSNIEDFIKNNNISIYCGTDPTSDSLHVGHLVPIITLYRLNKELNFKCYFLIGGATGMIGDPSFKAGERSFLDLKTVEYNSLSIEKQIKDIFKKNNSSIEIINNSEWYKNMNVIDFLREGKYLTVNYMSGKESVKKRIADDGMSFTEFSYQLLQAYDYLYLNEKYNINIQIGGADQWGNITAGIDIIRKKINKNVHGFSLKLLTKQDGTKFGKTESGCIWLDKTKTLPYDFFQFWINIPDSEIYNLYKVFSLKNLDEINILIQKHEKNPKENILQKELAKEMTYFIHGEDEMKNCITVSNILFGNLPFDEIIKIDNIYNLLKNINYSTIEKNNLDNYNSYYEFLCNTCIGQLFDSKSEINRCISNNMILVNKKKININTEYIAEDLKKNNFILIQSGKKNYFSLLLK